MMHKIPQQIRFWGTLPLTVPFIYLWLLFRALQATGIAFMDVMRDGYAGTYHGRSMPSYLIDALLEIRNDR